MKCTMLDAAVSAESDLLVQLNTAHLDAAKPAWGSSAQSSANRKPLFGLDGQAMAALMEELGEPAWRGSQLAEALYRQRVAELNEITTLSKPLRAKLAEAGWDVVVVEKKHFPREKTCGDGLTPRAVRQLVESGWHIEAEGKLFRRPGDSHMEVVSGIDWFELHHPPTPGGCFLLPSQPLPQLLRPISQYLRPAG